MLCIQGAQLKLLWGELHQLVSEKTLCYLVASEHGADLRVVSLNKLSVHLSDHACEQSYKESSLQNEQENPDHYVRRDNLTRPSRLTGSTI